MVGKTRSTLENLISLICLRFLNQPFSIKDVSKFMRVTDRQARSLMKTMLEWGLVTHADEYTSEYGMYVIVDLPKPAVEVLNHLLRVINDIKSKAGEQK